MRQLDSGNTPSIGDKTYDPRQRLDLIIAPQSEIMRTYAPLWSYGNRFSQHQSCTTGSPTAEMNKVPVIGGAVYTGILAHWGYGDPVREGHAT
jgi:hypothetical protein